MDAYSRTTWRKLAQTYRREHPHCTRCSHTTAHVDHRIPRRILTAVGVHDPDNPRWLQPLCERCHNAKTQQLDRKLLDTFFAPPESPVDVARLLDEAEAANTRWIAEGPG